eukprot:m.239673 g.239673  ORF g.239673 m.239673 type:complete len:378 (-) comp33749_c0_seq9:46-1179(-)
MHCGCVAIEMTSSNHRASRCWCHAFTIPYLWCVLVTTSVMFPSRCGSELAYLYTHIPKTGGSSFIMSIQEALLPCVHPMTVDLQQLHQRVLQQDSKDYDLWVRHRDTCNLISSEGVQAVNRMTAQQLWGAGSTRTQTVDDLRTIVFLRDPATHPLSMWRHCSNNQGVGPIPNGKRYAAMPLSTWLHATHYRNQSAAAYGCGYNPNNMQVSSLGGDKCTPTTSIWQCNTRDKGCGLDRENGCSLEERESNLASLLKKATQVVEEAAIVGVMEHFKESVCLARSLILTTSTTTKEHANAPPANHINASYIYTRCMADMDSSKPDHYQHIHKSKRVITTKDDRNMVAMHTAADSVLYRVALDRFHTLLADIGHPLAETVV